MPCRRSLSLLNKCIAPSVTAIFSACLYVCALFLIGCGDKATHTEENQSPTVLIDTPTPPQQTHSTNSMCFAAAAHTLSQPDAIHPDMTEANLNTLAHSTFAMASQEITPSVIDVLIVYSNFVKMNYPHPEKILQGHLDFANTVMANSDIPHRFRAVHIGHIDYDYVSPDDPTRKGSLEELKSPDDGYIDEIHTLRANYKADLVVFVSQIKGGLAYLPSFGYAPEWGFSITDIDNPFNFIHELAHNFGASHDPITLLNAQGMALHTTGYGYINVNKGFYTVMAYQKSCFNNAGCTGVPYFSSPSMTEPTSGAQLGDFWHHTNELEFDASLFNNRQVMIDHGETIARYSNILYPNTFDTMYLRGEFNDWDAQAMTMVDMHTWKGVLESPSTPSLFKFDATGQWQPDSNFGGTDTQGALEINSPLDLSTLQAGTFNITVNTQTLTYTLEPILATQEEMDNENEIDLPVEDTPQESASQENTPQENAAPVFSSAYTRASLYLNTPSVRSYDMALISHFTWSITLPKTELASFVFGLTQHRTTFFGASAFEAIATHSCTPIDIPFDKTVTIVFNEQTLNYSITPLKK